MLYRDPIFDIDQMQRTMRHLYQDYPLRDSYTKIDGRGVAMTAALTCTHCRKQMALRSHLLEKKDDNDKTSTGARDKHKNKVFSINSAASNVGAERK